MGWHIISRLPYGNPFSIWLRLMTDYLHEGRGKNRGVRDSKSKGGMMGMAMRSLFLSHTAFDRPADFFPHPTRAWLSSLISLKFSVLFIHVTDIRRETAFSIPWHKSPKNAEKYSLNRTYRLFDKRSTTIQSINLLGKSLQLQPVASRGIGYVTAIAPTSTVSRNII